MVQSLLDQEGHSKMGEFNHNGTFLNGSDNGQASQWNFTKTIQNTLEEITIDSNFAWLIFSLLIAMVWFTYITHYSSRVIGQILTRLLNRFAVGSGYVRIGKESLNFYTPDKLTMYLYLKVHSLGMHWLARLCFVILFIPLKISVSEFRMAG